MDGRFRRRRLCRPWDWKRTIGSDNPLCRMALFTRRAAEEEQHGVSIMWFVGCQTHEGEEDIIPWYQERQDEPDPGSRVIRNVEDEVFTVSTKADLVALRARVDVPTSGRLVLRLSPSEHIALRDGTFARAVGVEAERLGAIVDLEGARLSHMYFVLKRTGAEVVTKPIREGGHGSAIFRKLVRDKIPDKVAKGGESPLVAQLSPEEHLFALKIKLIEEAFEVRDSGAQEIGEELADVYEVLLALALSAGISLEELEAMRAAKAEKRGGFNKGLQLLETRFPPPKPSPTPLLRDDGLESDLLRAGKARPLEQVRSGGSDQRQGGAFTEFVKDLAVSLSTSSWRRTLGPVAFQDVGLDVAAVSIHGRRHGMDLRLRIKLRVGKQQLELPLAPDSDRDDGRRK